MAEGKDNQMMGNLRVLDQRAFEEFSGKLASLIDDAAISSRHLDELVNRTQTLSDNASSAKGQLDQRLELSARVLKVTKGQLDRVEGALGALNESQQKVEELSAGLRDQLTAFNTHLEEAMEEVDRRVTETVDGLSHQQKSSAEKQGRVEQLLEVAHALGDRFAAMESQLAGGVTRFQEGIESTLKEIATGNTQAERSSSKLDEQVFALKSRVVAFADGIEEWLKPALTEMESHRQDVERASDEVRRQFNDLTGRVGDALKDIEDRINIGLADFSSRQQSSERTTEQISASVTDLQSKLADWTSSLHNQYGQLGTITADSLKPLITQLTQYIDSNCVNEADLASRLGELQGRLESSFKQIEQPMARVEDLMVTALRALEHRRDAEDERVSAHLSAVQEQLTTLGGRVETEVAPLLDSLRQRLRDDLETKIIAATEKLDSRVAEILTELDARSRRVENETTTHHEQMNRLAEMIGGSVQRLESDITGPMREQLLDEVSKLMSGLSQGLPQAGKFTQDLEGLKEQLDVTAARLHGEVSGALAELTRRGSEQGERVTQQVGEVQAKLDEAVASMDRHVQTSLDALDKRAAQQDQELSARVGKLQEQLELIAGRIKNRVEPALGTLQPRMGKGEQSDGAVPVIEEVLERLQGQMGLVLERLDGRTVSAAPASSGGAAVGGGVDQRLNDIQEQLRDTVQQVDCRVAEILAEMGRSGPVSGGDGGGSWSASFAQLEERLKESLAAVAGGQPGGSIAAVSPELADRLSAVSDQLQVVDRRLAGLEPHLDKLEDLTGVEPTGGDRIGAETITTSMGQLESRIGEIVAESERRMLDALASLEEKLDGRPGMPAESSLPEFETRRPSSVIKASPHDANKLVTSLLDAINSADPQVIRRFVATEYAESALSDRSADDRIEVYVSFHEDAGDLELRHIEKSDRNEIVALVQERGTMEWHRLQFQLEPDPPHKILLVNIDAV